MPLLTTTLAFLLIFSIFSIAREHQFKNEFIKNATYSACFEAVEQKQIAKINARAAYLVRQHGQKGQDKGRRTRFLHLQSLIQTGELPGDSPEARAAREILCNLIMKLYGKKTFFQEARMNRKRTEELVLKIFTLCQDNPVKDFIKEPQDLCNLDLDDEVLQDVLYKMIKGNTPQIELGKTFPDEENYKSLTHFICFEKKTILLSVYLAPPDLLFALFQNRHDVDDIIDLRRELWKLQQSEKKQLPKKKQPTENKESPPQVPQESQQLLDLKRKFESFKEKVPPEINSSLIDFEVSKTNPDHYEREEDST